jgi:transposase InsO family protein
MRYEPKRLPDEDEISQKIIYLACNFGRYGYRTIAGMLRNMGNNINHKRVERIWHKEGLKVPKKQQKRQRIFLNDGSCIRLRATHKNHVWSYDFVEDKTMDGRKIRFLNIIDEYTRECITSIPRRSWRKNDVIELLANLILTKGAPEYLRSDNGPEFVKKNLVKWLKEVGITATFIEPGSPWENGYCESFNGKMRNEFLNGELFGNLYEATALTKMWVKHYNTIRPHSALGYKPPAPESITPGSFFFSTS